MNIFTKRSLLLAMSLLCSGLLKAAALNDAEAHLYTLMTKMRPNNKTLTTKELIASEEIGIASRVTDKDLLKLVVDEVDITSKRHLDIETLCMVLNKAAKCNLNVSFDKSIMMELKERNRKSFPWLGVSCQFAREDILSLLCQSSPKPNRYDSFCNTIKVQISRYSFMLEIIQKLLVTTQNKINQPSFIAGARKSHNYGIVEGLIALSAKAEKALLVAQSLAKLLTYTHTTALREWEGTSSLHKENVEDGELTETLVSSGYNLSDLGIFLSISPQAKKTINKVAVLGTVVATTSPLFVGTYFAKHIGTKAYKYLYFDINKLPEARKYIGHMVAQSTEAHACASAIHVALRYTKEILDKFIPLSQQLNRDANCMICWTAPDADNEQIAMLNCCQGHHYLCLNDLEVLERGPITQRKCPYCRAQLTNETVKKMGYREFIDGKL